MKGTTMTTTKDLTNVAQDIVDLHPKITRLDITFEECADGCHSGYAIKINKDKLPPVDIDVAFGILNGLLYSAELA